MVLDGLPLGVSICPMSDDRSRAGSANGWDECLTEAAPPDEERDRGPGNER